MVVRVEPGLINPTHHISLTEENGKTIGLILCDSKGNANPEAIRRAPMVRTAMKTTTGNQKYSDFEPPWTPLAQEDWSGGRGSMDFDKDITRYMDSHRANAVFGKIINGPQEVYTKGYRGSYNYLPGSMTWTTMIAGSRKYLAGKVITDAAFSATGISLWIRRRGTPTAALTVELRSDNTNKPGTLLQSATVTTNEITDTISEFYRFTISSQAVSSGVVYWIVVYSTAGDSENYWQVGVKNAIGSSKESSDGSLWTDSAVDLYYRLTDAFVGYDTKFFSYKYALYMVRQAGSTVKLYINGDRGAADPNTGALTTLVDATKSWTVNEFAGCVVLITAGPGSTESKNWRTVVSNTATTLTLDTAWEIEHTTSTEYVILGSDTWREITGHGLSAKVTSILIVNDIIYFAMGDSVNIRRIRFYNNAGTWTTDPADDSTNKATHLCTVRDTTNGLEIWRSNNLDGSGFKSVSKASVVDWGTNLTFGAATNTTFKDSYGKITGLLEYGDTTKQLWVMREGSIFTINSGKPDEIPLSELHTVAETTNGQAGIIHNVYLIFNLGAGVEKYYSRNMDDVGPNRDDGMPAHKQGVISCLLGYPGMYFAGIDGDTSNYSTLLVNNNVGAAGAGWHELYRSQMKGDRIRSLAFQPIGGRAADRLWIAVGDDVIYLPFPSMTLDPTKDSAARYTHESVIVTGYMYAGLYDIYKFYNSIKVFAENLAKDQQYIEMDYQLDDETAWTPIKGVWYQSPMQEVLVKESGGANGKRFRFRIRTQTADNTKTPIIKSTVVETISRVPVKHSYSLAYRMVDYDVDLEGNKSDLLASDIAEIIDTWATELTPLVMRSTKKQFDNKTVFIDPTPLDPYAERREKYIAKLTVVEA